MSAPSDTVETRGSATRGWTELGEVLVTPQVAFQKLLPNHVWLPAYIFSAVLMLVTTILMMDKVLVQLETQVASTGSQSASTLAFIHWITLGGSLIGAVVGPLLSALIMAGLFFVLGLIINKPAPFVEYMTIALYSRIPTILGGFLNSILIFFGLSSLAQPLSFSPLVFLSQVKQSNILYSLLASLDILVLWGIGLTVAGLAVAHKTSVRRVAWTGFFIYLLSLSITLTLNLFAQGVRSS